uniref:Tripartite motif-containing protein 45-like n=1 Tax=Crassostrea virginica TaxID=6565 RepID=A0A8B8C467_CRAVI|nr:tripartite motif-containing protein 45-like [Crassostrea virginica]
MDPQDCGQDVVRCTLCKDAVAPMYCEVCHIDLCKDCVVEHLSDTDGFHKVVSLKQFLLTLRYNSVCPNHPTKQCEQHCEECNVSVCGICVSSKEHDQHKKEDILKILTTKKALIQKDLLEIKKSIYSKYQEAAKNIPIQRADVRKHSEQVIAVLNKQKQALHTEIDTIVQRMMTEINEMEKQHTPAIEKQEHAINKTMNEIKQVILDLKSLLETSDVGLVCKYKSKIEEFRKLPPKLKIFLPKVSSQKINRKQLLKQFGLLSPLFIETEDQGYTMPSPEADSSPLDRPLLDVPRLITDIPTTGFEGLYSVSCLSDE